MTKLNGKQRSVATADVCQVVTKDHAGGAIEGLFLGAITSAGVFTIATLLMGNLDTKPDGGGVYAVIVGGLAGGLLGIGIGAAAGHTYEYQFVPDSTQSLQR